MKYYVSDYSGPEDAYELKTHWSGNSLFAAEEAAEHFHDNHDGWESTWPLVFVLLDDDLNELGRFSVDREAVPHFIAMRITEDK
jgi:hypothetical protein